MSKVRGRQKRSKEEVLRLVSAEEVLSRESEPNSRLMLIQQLIPLGLEAVNEALQAEVIRPVEGCSRQQGDHTAMSVA